VRHSVEYDLSFPRSQSSGRRGRPGSLFRILFNVSVRLHHSAYCILVNMGVDPWDGGHVPPIFGLGDAEE